MYVCICLQPPNSEEICMYIYFLHLKFNITTHEKLQNIKYYKHNLDFKYYNTELKVSAYMKYPIMLILLISVISCCVISDWRSRS